MTRAANTSHSLLDTMAGLYSGMAQLLPVATLAAQRSLQMQEAVAAEVNGAAHRWLDRRQEAVSSLVGCAQQVMEKGLTDSSAAFGAVQDWYGGAMQRLAADLKSPAELMVACSAHMLPPAAATTDKPAAPIRRAA